MIFTSFGVGLFKTDTGHVVDPDNGYCLCKGFYFNKKCKHLDYFKEWGYKYGRCEE